MTQFQFNSPSTDPQCQHDRADVEEFVFAVSHELKSPLLTFIGYISYIKQDLQANRTDRLAEFAAHLESATRRMRRSVEDLSALSKIVRPTRKLAPVDLSDVAREVVAMHSNVIAERKASVVVQGSMSAVMADRGHLSHLLDNLFMNALAYATEGPDANIEIGTRPQDGEIHLFVQDDGPGIAESHREKIFDLFQRFNPNGEGSGAGLAIVARIAALYGGRAWVESPPGHGATFWVAFPEI